MFVVRHVDYVGVTAGCSQAWDNLNLLGGHVFYIGGQFVAYHVTVRPTFSLHHAPPGRFEATTFAEGIRGAVKGLEEGCQRRAKHPYQT